MKTKNLLLIAIAVLSLAGCKYDDDAIWDAVRNLEERMISLETWQKKASDEIALLKAITDESDYILSVVPIMEGDTQKGYTITFKKSGAITLLNGQKGDKGDKGDTPLVSLKQEKDGNWYWTLNGSLMTDASGAPIRANGANGTNGTNGTPAPTPQLKTGRQLKVDSVTGNWQDDAFYLSVDNGKTWNKVSGDKGDKGDKGDAGTGSSIKITEDDPYNDYVTFEVDGQKIKVQLYDKTLSLVITDGEGRVVLRGEERSAIINGDITFTLSEVAEGSSVSLVLSSSSQPGEGWTITQQGSNYVYYANAPTKNENLTATLTFTVTNYYGKKSEYPISLRAFETLSCNADNLEAMLEKYPNVEKLKVSGTLTKEHMTKIKGLGSLKEIDLEDATLEGNTIPEDQFRDKNTLTTVKLPKGVEKIGDGAFWGCSALSDIEIGNQVTALPKFVFKGCSSLKSITVPASVKGLDQGAFQDCSSLETITIEEGLEYINGSVFARCSKITKITLPSTVNRMEALIFLNCSSLSELQCLATTPPEFDYIGANDALGGGLHKNFKITVPSNLVGAYKNAEGWKQYSIEAIQ